MFSDMFVFVFVYLYICIKLSIGDIKVVLSVQLTISIYDLYNFLCRVYYVLKNKGPNTESCGIPIFIDVVVDSVDLIWTK